MRSWIQTYTGKRFDALDPKIEDVDILDIAHHLSNLCRFGGATTQFYSVAQHSVSVSNLVPEKYALPALLHDGSEAYLIDVPHPLKVQLAFTAYRDIEARLSRLIYEKFIGKPYIEADNDEYKFHLTMADRTMLKTERRDLLHDSRLSREAWDWEDACPDVQVLSNRILPQPPGIAERLFMRRFDELTRDNPFHT